jgi:GNAT superfamily N-acetyltransferase
MPELTEAQARRRRRNAGANLVAGGTLVGGAAAISERVRSQTGGKSNLAAVKDAAKARKVGPGHGKRAAVWLGTRGLVATGAPMAVLGAKNLLSEKPRNVRAVNIKRDVIDQSVSRTTALPKPGPKVPLKARAAEIGTVTAGTAAGGLGGAALGRRAPAKWRLASVGLGTALGSTGGALASAPLGRRAVRHSTGGEYDYSTERGTHRVRKLDSGDAAINTLARHEQKTLINRKRKQSTYSLASAGLGATALGLKAPALAGVVVRRAPKSPKALRRFAATAPRSDKLATNVGIGSLGVGSLGSLNFARIQRSEVKADQRSSNALKKVSKRVLVTGSRDWDDRDAVHAQLDRLHREHGNVEVIEGGATGADTHAREWATAKGRPLKTYKAQWKKHGRSAGPRRNQQMLDEAKPERVIAFSRDLSTSRGTKDMVRRAQKAGVPVEVYGGKVNKAVKLPDGSWARLRSGARTPGLHEIGAYRKGKNIGYMTLREDRLPSGALGRKERLVHHIKVEPEHQRKGVATAMWNRAEKANLHPMHNWGHQSAEGKAWASSQKVKKMHLKGNRSRQVDVAKALLPKPKFFTRPVGHAGIRVGGVRRYTNPYTGQTRQVAYRGSVG